MGCWVFLLFIVNFVELFLNDKKMELFSCFGVAFPGCIMDRVSQRDASSVEECCLAAGNLYNHIDCKFLAL